MVVNRTERHIINKTHPMYKVIDELSFKSKNVYNYGNYIIRQEFINNGKWIRYKDLSKQIKHSDCFKDLGSNSAQMTLRILDKTWKSFFSAIKDWSKNPSKYLGRPKIPKYKDKLHGRFILTLTNMQTHIYEGYLYFAFKDLRPFNNMIKTDVKEKLMQTRFIPKGDIYVLEIVYEKEIRDVNIEGFKNIIGIDLGLDNFVTMVNNIGGLPIVINGKIIKSINQYYNKQLGHYKSLAKTNNKLDWTKRLQQITTKRNNRMNNFLHKSSKTIIDYCLFNNIDTIVIGKNDTWKQNCELGKATQSFIQIPHAEFIDKLKYKCENIGVNLIITEESYTSKASFIDMDCMPKYGEKFNYEFSGKRVYRGLYKSREGKLINADCNGAYNIIRKVFPNTFVNGIEGAYFHPVVVSVI